MPDTPKYPRQPYLNIHCAATGQSCKTDRQPHRKKRLLFFSFSVTFTRPYLATHDSSSSHPMVTIIILRQGRKNWVIAPGFQNIVYGALVAIIICIFILEAKKAQKEDSTGVEFFGVSG